MVTKTIIYKTDGSSLLKDTVNSYKASNII